MNHENVTGMTKSMWCVVLTVTSENWVNSNGERGCLIKEGGEKLKRSRVSWYPISIATLGNIGV